MLSSSSMHPSSSSAETDFMASSEETRLNIPEITEEQEEKEEGLENLIDEADTEVSKRLVDIFLLMSTIVAGSCYAAMLTLSSDNFGSLSDLTTLAYLFFVFWNLVGVFCAILTVVSIIWSYFFEKRSAKRALETWAKFFTGAMMSMTAALTSGAVVVVKKSETIRAGVLILGLFFTVMVYRLGIPLVVNARWRQIMGGRARDR
ncbi:uncharacterized protein LOC121790258 isoform X1 [Salvia splendens]|uniref:uncharacterized protein LOC121790258 isoform X1 n=1 Tax=Salvia splendens TaxID=180675 RepID=UPI001C279290|nr:uncharacterized protein LOC121790258 isoform X1 [Salvia splendens]